MEAGIDRKRGGDDHQRVAVGVGTRGERRAYGAAAAVAVIDMDRDYGSPENLPTGATVVGDGNNDEPKRVAARTPAAKASKPAVAPKTSAKASTKPPAASKASAGPRAPSQQSQRKKGK